MKAGYWKRTDTKTLLEHPRLKVVEDDVVLPDGYKTKYMRFEDLQDWVTIIAVQKDKLAIIKDYSYPLDERLWQLPEGLVEAGESIEEVANRELREEAGLAAAELKLLGMNYGDHRRSTRKNYIFLASNVSEVEKTAGDEEEQGMELHWFTLSELKVMILNGTLVQKHALAALTFYWAYTDVSA